MNERSDSFSASPLPNRRNSSLKTCCPSLPISSLKFHDLPSLIRDSAKSASHLSREGSFSVSGISLSTAFSSTFRLSSSSSKPAWRPVSLANPLMMRWKKLSMVPTERRPKLCSIPSSMVPALFRRLSSPCPVSRISTSR